MLRRARSTPRRPAWLRGRGNAAPQISGPGLELSPTADPRGWWSRRAARPGARLAVEDGELVALGARGLRIDLPTAQTLWTFRCGGRDGLAVLDRYGAALLVIEGPFDPYRVRAFADRAGLAVWLGALSEAEPRYRLTGVQRLRGRTGRPPVRARLRRWTPARDRAAPAARR
jgi:hypothetical protein